MNNELMNLIDTVEIESISTSLNKVESVQAVIQKTLKSGHDFDVIPGTQKPTLLKPGAEKILMIFGLTSEYEIIEQIEDWNKGVFAYTVRCILSKNGMKITEGLGNSNSKEDKYRYRWVKADDVPVGIDISTLKVKKSSYGPNYDKYRIDNDEIYSQVNTILKMAKKRAQIDATLTVSSLSEIFTQDIEDLKQFIKAENTENMTVQDAKNIRLNFGKYKGNTLGEINDVSYYTWLSEKANDEIIKKAAKLLLQTEEKNSKEPTDEELQNAFYGIDGDDVPF